MVAVRKHLRWVNGQKENNARCSSGRRTAKYTKYANGNPVFIFAWFVWFAVESGGGGFWWPCASSFSGDEFGERFPRVGAGGPSGTDRLSGADRQPWADGFESRWDF